MNACTDRGPMTRLVETTDCERRRIAHDLHDGLQSRLVLMGLTALKIERDPSASKSVREGVRQLRAELGASITELRRLAAGVMPVVLVERGLYRAVEDFAAAVPLPTELRLTGSPDSLPTAVETAAYFVVTEVVTNALKHARARTLTITLDCAADALRLAVADDGVGGARPHGSGLTGLADRVSALGGRLDVCSPAGAGTRVTAQLPTRLPLLEEPQHS